MEFPASGLSKDQILATLRGYKTGDLDWRSGRVLGYVYDPGPEVEEVIQSAYMLFLSENGLDPTTYPSLLRLENEVTRMLANLLHGDDQVVGNATSGGTESILLAVKTARDRARRLRPQITAPEMVLPQTAHASFHKAAHYLGVRPVLAPFDPATFRADAAAMRRAVTENTILLVASAPCYSQGVVDPIPEIAALAQECDLLLHVDACVGGLHLSMMRRLGHAVPEFDFRLPGVTSISVDMHKYGYAAKGCSAILYRDRQLRRHQIFSCMDTTAYAIINPTVLSSKSGGPLAGAWAILHALGEEGYRRIVASVQDATRQLVEGIDAIDGLRVLGKPDMCMFSFASETLNVFQLADAMRRRGWYLQPQFATPLSPRNLHISVNLSTVRRVEALLDDLRACVEELRRNPPPDLAPLAAGIAAQLDPPTPEAVRQVAAAAGVSSSELPQEMALINELLDTLPDPVANELLIEFFNDLYA